MVAVSVSGGLGVDCVSIEIVCALLSLIGTLAGTFGGIMISNRLTNYRIEQLEKKMEKHNNLIERMALVEQNDKTMWKRIDELKAKVED